MSWPTDDDLARLRNPPVPPHLLDATLARLEAERLVSGAGPALPAGLLERTLERLEAARLVAPAATSGVRPTRPRRWLHAAAWLGAALLGGGAGYAVRGERTVVATVERPVPGVTEVPVEVVREILVEKLVEVPVEKVVERVVERRIDPPAFQTTRARDVEAWSFQAGSWSAVRPGDRLEAGTPLRGRSSEASLAADGEPVRLGQALCVVTAAGAIGKLPAEPPPPAPRPLPVSPDDEEDLQGEALVRALVRRWSTGSREERAQAQAELTKLWRLHGSDRPEPAAVFPRLAMRAEPEPPRPPTTAQGWLAWWRRIEGEGR